MAKDEPSEFGGYSGLVQPAPHEPTAREKLRVPVASDPADPNALESPAFFEYERAETLKRQSQ